MSVEQVQNLSTEALRQNQKVNIVGFVKDFQPPVKTKGPGTYLAIFTVSYTPANWKRLEMFHPYCGFFCSLWILWPQDLHLWLAGKTAKGP
jgi:hypothetical protein